MSIFRAVSPVAVHAQARAVAVQSGLSVGQVYVAALAYLVNSLTFPELTEAILVGMEPPPVLAPVKPPRPKGKKAVH